VRDGEARVVRGGIAAGVLSDIRDVVAHPPVGRATVRVVRGAGRAQLEIRGDVSEEQRQQLRNVVGSVPLAKLAKAPRR
jgi:RNase P/RNase MRP subunit p29